MKAITRLVPLALLFTGACADVEDPDHDHDHNHGLVTTLVLTFTPTGGGESLSFTWSDPEDDGDPVVDDIVLPSGSEDGPHVALAYALDIALWNDLEDPAEDVTPEIEEGAEEHQLFFTGSAVEGPATGDNAAAVLAHAYADLDDNGLPIGLSNTVTTLARGTGALTVTLRHLPPEDGAAVKVSGLADDVAGGGFGAIGGDTDVQVTFAVEVL